MLSDSESDATSNDIQLTINEHYANAYAVKKEREELSKLKEKYGSGADLDDLDSEEDSDEDSTEDEDGEQLTPAVDAAIFRTLAKIKQKDPEIYEVGKSIFEKERQQVQDIRMRATAIGKNNSKPVKIKQQVLASMLESSSRSPSPDHALPTHVENQEAIRTETISAFQHAVEEHDEEDFLVLREKTKDELEREEEEYREFLKREVGENINGLITVENNLTVAPEDAEGEQDRKTLKQGSKSVRTKGKGRQETDQEFLVDYILNRGWIDRSTKRIPTYKEITHNSGDSKEQISEQSENNTYEDLEEKEFEEIAETFETSYNFRFEEADAATIPTHPRNIESAVRRKDNTRKAARERRKERKEEDLRKKREEIKRLKSLKMKELRQKLEQIGREGGIEIDPDAWANLNLDDDWDPENHDKQMARLYEDEEEGDMEKPHWDDDIDITDIITKEEKDPTRLSKKKKTKAGKQSDRKDNDGVDVDAMDADNPKDEEEWDGTEEMRKRKVQEYMDAIHGMDFNDMVGDMPTRFSYIPVAAQSHSLTPAEILLATDKELNEYMSIKRVAPYRKEKWSKDRAEKLKELRQKLKARDAGNNQDMSLEKVPKKRKGKKERQRAKKVEEGSKVITGGEDEGISEPHPKKQRKE